MSMKPLPALALLAGLGVAACDNTEEYESQIVALEGQLETARGEVAELETQLSSAAGELDDLETMRTELEAAQARVAELEARPTREELEAELQDASASGSEGGLEELRTELESARARLAELEAGGGGQAAATTPIPTESVAGSPEEFGAGPALASGALREPLSAAISALRTVDQQLAQLRDTLVGEGYEDIEIEQPRSYLEAAGQSIARAAEAAGIDPQSLEP